MRSAYTYHEHVYTSYEVLQIGKVGDYAGPNRLRLSGDYNGLTDRVNEVELPMYFEPGVTYTVKLTVFGLDLWRTEHRIKNTVEYTFTKRKRLHIFYFNIHLFVR